MRKLLLLAIAVVVLGALDAQEPGEVERESVVDVSLLSVRVTPGVDFALQSSTRPVFATLAYGVDLLGWLPLPFLPLVAPAFGLNYTLVPIQAETSFSSVGVGLGLALVADTGRFQFSASGLGGGYLSFLNQTALDPDGVAYADQSGAAGYLSAGVDVSYLVTPYLSIGIGALYHNMLGLYQSIRAHLNATLNVHGLRPRVEMEEIELDPIFPALVQYYGGNPVGTAKVTNDERFPISNVQVELFIPEYMTSPRTGSQIGTLAPGESADVTFNALFTDRVLSRQEGGQLGAELTVRYELNGRERERVVQDTVRMHDRNALTWDDDKKAAAFVSSRDPEIIRFASSVAGLVRREGPPSLNPNMRLGIGMYEALSLYGLSYVIDPTTPGYIDASENLTIVDFLQYPRQTFDFRGGDCDDLSILYTSLLEAVGVPTAFVTIPGHIFPAFSLGISSAEAVSMFGGYDDFLDIDGEAWMPVEVTLVGEPFSEAWSTGAEQSRASLESGQLRFYPMTESWALYPPSGFPAEGSQARQIAVEDPDPGLEANYTREVTILVQRELLPKVQRLRQTINSSRNPERALNRLGVLYARYGLEEEAKRSFEEVLFESEYPPALVNLANLLYLAGDLEGALGYYERAAVVLPDEPAVLLSLARVNHELNQFAEARFHFAQLQEVDPQTSEEWGYLASVEDTGSRAADVDLARQRMLWLEEEDE